MKRVVLESPYAGDVDRNVEYARACIRDSVLRGEAPIASHLLFTQPRILNDFVAEERARGIAAGHAWIAIADTLVVYDDHGISEGMKAGIEHAKRYNVPVEYRKLNTAPDQSHFHGGGA